MAWEASCRLTAIFRYPLRRRRVQLDGVVVVTRCAVSVIDFEDAFAQHRLRIADFEFRRLTDDILRQFGLRLQLVERQSRFLRVVFDVNQRCRLIGHFLRLGNHDRHRLPVPMDPLILKHRQIAHRRAASIGRHIVWCLHSGRVLVCHHGNDTGQTRRLAAVYSSDAPFRDRAQRQCCIRQIVEWNLCSKACRTGHLERSIDSG